MTFTVTWPAKIGLPKCYNLCFCLINVPNHQTLSNCLWQYVHLGLFGSAIDSKFEVTLESLIVLLNCDDLHVGAWCTDVEASFVCALCLRPIAIDWGSPISIHTQSTRIVTHISIAIGYRLLTTINLLAFYQMTNMFHQGFYTTKPCFMASKISLWHIMAYLVVDSIIATTSANRSN